MIEIRLSELKAGTYFRHEPEGVVFLAVKDGGRLVQNTVNWLQGIPAAGQEEVVVYVLPEDNR